MTDFYSEMQAIATDILTEFKQGIITYIKVTPANGPRDNPGSPTLTSFVMVGGTASGPAFKFISQGLALTSDKQVIAPVDPRYTPDKKDFVDIDGMRYKILEVEARPAAGIPAAYAIIIRKDS